MHLFLFCTIMKAVFRFHLQCLAHVEAFIDFSEGELIEDGVLNQGASPNLRKK